ncbi:MAG: hypothetical protein OXG36_01765, partial [Caldilineaceae bacterium]|nr:hypothetical protein [Caldilineaceae bacterium]
GPIPPELQHLANLQVLDLSHNRLTGPVPTELAHWARRPHLESLHLDGNALTGCLPAAWQDRFAVTTRTNGQPQILPYCPD